MGSTRDAKAISKKIRFSLDTKFVSGLSEKNVRFRGIENLHFQN